jgi:hypothetical protein
VTDAPAPVIMVLGMSKQTRLGKLKENSPQKRHNTNKPTEKPGKTATKKRQNAYYIQPQPNPGGPAEQVTEAPAPVVGFFKLENLGQEELRNRRTQAKLKALLCLMQF